MCWKSVLENMVEDEGAQFRPGKTAGVNFGCRNKFYIIRFLTILNG